MSGYGPGKVKVTDEMRIAIREMYGDGTRFSLLTVANEFGLSRTTVSSVVNNHVRAREIKMQLAKEKTESTI